MTASLVPELAHAVARPGTRVAAQATLAVVIPAYREEKNLPVLCEELHKILDGKVRTLSIVLVDDGSPDNTAQVIDAVAQKDPCVVGVFLARNFGHQTALTAGLDMAAALDADLTVSMDGDMQHPPALIPKLLELWEQGNDVVITSRNSNKDASLLKRVTSSLIYKVLRRLGQRGLPQGAADFRLLSRHALRAFASMREQNRFLRGMVAWSGFKTAVLEYDADSRLHGKSSYSISKMVTLAMDGLLDAGPVPLRVAGWLGLLVTTLTGTYAAYVFYAWAILNVTVPGWSSLMLVVMFLGATQLLSLGLVGEYLGRVYMQGKARPLYTVGRITGQPAAHWLASQQLGVEDHQQRDKHVRGHTEEPAPSTVKP